MEPGQYYALCQEGEIVALDLGKNENGTVLALAVYTSPDGEAQQKDLEYLEMYDDIAILPVSPQELLDAVTQTIPNTVFIDGRKLAGSVVQGMLKDELSIPIKRPRLIKPEDLSE